MSAVLVTGGSGFVGVHALLQLLAAGHDVRTTVRRPDRQADVLAMLREGGVPASGQQLGFFAADLTRDEGWRNAVEGCDYVLHVASPLSSTVPKDENEMIIPARDGTVRVLRAARDAGVKRVVVTSSLAAIGYGHAPRDRPFDETDWTNLDAADALPYVKSKTLAERAAWDFIAREGGGLELAVVNPTAIFGPVLGPDFSGSIDVVKSLLDGAVPAVPRIYLGVVDVRDVVDLHLRSDDGAPGEGGALHRGGGRDAVDPRHRQYPAAGTRPGGPTGSELRGTGLGGARGRDRRPPAAPGRTHAGQDAPVHQCQGDSATRLAGAQQ